MSLKRHVHAVVRATMDNVQGTSSEYIRQVPHRPGPSSTPSNCWCGGPDHPDLQHYVAKWFCNVQEVSPLRASGRMKSSTERERGRERQRSRSPAEQPRNGDDLRYLLQSKRARKQGAVSLCLLNEARNVVLDMGGKGGGGPLILQLLLNGCC